MLTGHGVSTRQAATLTGLVRSTATRRRNAATALTPAVCTEPAVEPANKLTDAERRRVVEVLTSDRFVDLAPLQIYAQLLDEGVYLCSVSTMYRVLAAHAVAERRRLARHPSQVCPELVATAPQQVYSWDIAKLAGPVKGTYFDAYVMIDIYSRYLVGVHVHAHESGVLARELMEQIFRVHGVPQVVHADRGTSMTSKTVATLLADLEVTRSHSAATGVQRQSVLGVAVQDVEVRTSVSRALRINLGGKAIHGYLHPLVQPRASSHRHRFAHTRRRALRVGHRRSRRPAHGTDPSPRPTPAPLRHRRGAKILDLPDTA